MNEEKIPECPEGHGEMVPAMGEVKKGELRRIEQTWGARPAGKSLRYPSPKHTLCLSDTTSGSACPRWWMMGSSSAIDSERRDGGAC